MFGVDPLKSSFVLLTFVFLCLGPLDASAQLGGAVDRGGDNALPDQDHDGPGLTKIFSEGVALLTKRDCKLAEKKFIRVLKDVPRNSEANYLRGLALQCQDKHKQAIRYFKRARRDDASFYRAYAELGMSYLILNRPDLAEPQLFELNRMVGTCGERCPAHLLKSVAKLRKAMQRIDGAEPKKRSRDSAR